MKLRMANGEYRMSKRSADPGAPGANGLGRVRILALLASCIPSGGAWAQSQPAPANNAAKLVREANELLLGDKPAEALRTYEQAQFLRPESREIAFDQALAHYRLGELDKARDAFTRAAGGAADSLADDAQYGLGTCDHAEALSAQDPREAVGKIENAMRNYQNVLANRREHAIARDANLKAASYWRQLKQQLEQQQQQEQQDQQNQDKNDEKQQDQQQQEQQSPQEQQSQQNQEEEQKQSQAEQEQQEQREKEQQQQQEQKASAQERERQQKERTAEEKEDASRDQAERKLREMMQAMRDRKKHRREEAKTPTYRPTEKDW